MTDRLCGVLVLRMISVDVTAFVSVMRRIDQRRTERVLVITMVMMSGGRSCFAVAYDQWVTTTNFVQMMRGDE